MKEDVVVLLYFKVLILFFIFFIEYLDNVLRI